MVGTMDESPNGSSCISVRKSSASWMFGSTAFAVIRAKPFHSASLKFLLVKPIEKVFTGPGLVRAIPPAPPGRPRHSSALQSDYRPPT